MIRRSRVVIVICPSLEDTVRGIEPQARTVLIENAPDRPRTATPEQAAAVRRTLGLGEQTPIVLYTGTFEAYQGLDLLFEAMAIVRDARPDVRLVLAGGKPDQVDRSARMAVAAGHRGRHDLRRRASGGGDSGLPACGRRARVAAIARHEHAAQDLSVSALGQTDRRDAAPDTHAGLERRHRVSDGGDAAGVRAGHRRGALTDRERAATVGRQARQLADTKYSYEAYLERTRQACDALTSPAPPGAVVKDVA